MATLREKLVALVGADISDYAGKVGRQVPAIAKRAASAVKRIGSVGGRALKVLGSAARAATSAISGAANMIRSGLRKAVMVGTIALSAMTAEAVGYQHAMAEVASISDSVRTNLQAQSRAVADLGVKYGKVPKEMARGLYQTISAGITDPKEAMKFLDVASKAGIAGLTDVRTAVDVLTSAVNAYGKSADWAGHVSDVLFTAVREGKTTLPELASSMGRVMAIAAQTGVSIEDLGAAVATLTKGGISTDLAVTSLRQTLVSVLKPGKEAKDLAKELGVEFNAGALAAKGLGGFLAEVKRATRGDAEAMATLFPNVRALSGVMGLAGSQSKEFARQLKVMAGVAGATEKAFKVMADTTKFRLAQAWASIRSSFGRMGEVLLPTVERAVSGVAGLVGKAAEWVGGHATEIRGLLDELWDWVTAKLGWLRDRGGELLNEIKADHETTWDAIKRKAGDIWEDIKTVFEGARTLLSPAWTALKDMLRGDWDKALDGLAEATSAGIDLVVGILAEAIPRFIEVGIKFVGGLVKGMREKGTLDKIGELVGDIVKLLLDPENLKVFTSIGLDLGRAIVSGIWQAVKAGAGDLLGLGESEWEREDREAIEAAKAEGWTQDPEGGQWFPPELPQGDQSREPVTPAGETEARSPAPKTSVTNNFFYPTDRNMHEMLARDIARLNRRGRAVPAYNW